MRMPPKALTDFWVQWDSHTQRESSSHLVFMSLSLAVNSSTQWCFVSFSQAEKAWSTLEKVELERERQKASLSLPN